MPKRRHLSITAILLCLSLAACSADLTTSQPSAQTATLGTTSTVVPLRTPTGQSPTPHPTVTSTSTPLPTLVIPDPMPPFPGTTEFGIPFTEFFLAGFSSDCALPCWYGLNMVESHAGDVQRVFDEELGLGGAINLFEPHAGVIVNIDPDFYLRTFPQIEGLIGTGFAWGLDWYSESQSQVIGQSIIIAAYVNDETLALEGLVFRAANDAGASLGFTLEHLLITIDAPSTILIQPPEEQPGLMEVARAVIYNEGLTTFQFSSLSRVERDGIQMVEYCPRSATFSEESSGVTILLTRPLASRLDNLSQLEYAVVGSFIEGFNLRPLEDVFGASTEQVTEMILTGDDACLYSKITDN